jgi:tRNA(Ile)-lysidine synthase
LEFQGEFQENFQTAFNESLEKLGPFEDNPHLAVAVSGGSDSVSLALLVKTWVRQHIPKGFQDVGTHHLKDEGKTGTLTALIVDHGLRQESAAEAQQVCMLLASHQIPAVILRWTEEKPHNRLQERAREARYRLLTEWCCQHQVLHLLLGHHQDDQRETFQLRRAKKSGILGLSGMSSILETPSVRILRPLLQFPKSRLRRYLTLQNIPFVEDPSNANLKYSRTALRRETMPPQEQEQLERKIERYGFRRIQKENEINTAVSECVEVFSEGYGILDRSAYQKLSSKRQQDVLQRCIMTFGVGQYPPRRDSLEIIMKNLGTTCTLHGCLIFNRQGKIFFVREPQGIECAPLSGKSNTLRWDDRFILSFLPDASLLKNDDDKTHVGPLKEKGWTQIKQTPEGELLKAFPHPVRLGFPSLWKGSRFFHLLMPFSSKFTKQKGYVIYFAPRYPLTRFTFTIV